MEEIRRQTIEGKYLNIDGKGFIDCTLIDCILEYSGGPVSFHRTRFQRCSYVFVGRAKRTVHFLQGTGLMPHDPAEWGHFSDHVH